MMPLPSTARSISSGSTVIGSSSTSGVMPVPWIEMSPGSVRYCAMVSLSAALSGMSLKTSCTLPFPKLVWPTMTARSWFFIAPATISLALAELPFTRRAIG